MNSNAAELLYLADQQAHARARYNEDDTGLIRESKVIEWTLRQAALRASAAPEEGGKKVWDEGEHEGCGIESERAFKREQIDAELARTLTDGAAYVQQIRSTVIEECARVAENYGEAGSGSRNQKRRSGIANAIRALPSDSGKAAPVAWQFQRHDGKWFNCDSKPKDLDKNPHKYRPLYEGGGREWTLEVCAQIAEAIDSGRGNEKQIAKTIRALSPSPSGGTAAQPSADRGTP